MGRLGIGSLESADSGDAEGEIIVSEWSESTAALPPRVARKFRSTSRLGGIAVRSAVAKRLSFRYHYARNVQRNSSGGSATPALAVRFGDRATQR
jgi:hypothetical protein